MSTSPFIEPGAPLPDFSGRIAKNIELADSQRLGGADELRSAHLTETQSEWDRVSEVGTFTDCYAAVGETRVKLGKVIASHDAQRNLNILENVSAPPLPLVRLEIERDSTRFRCNVQPSDRSSKAWILSTRLSYYLENGFPVQIANKDRTVSPLFVADSPSAKEKEHVQFFAKLSRKVAFLEQVFGCQFELPDIYHPSVIRDIELAFRGITEGQFTQRGLQVVICGVIPAEVSLAQPPFTTPGPFSYAKRDPIKLFGRSLRLGQVTISFDCARIANQSIVRKMAQDPAEPLDIRFMVFDNRTTYKFAEYSSAKDRKAKLIRLSAFKKRLAAEEAAEIVSLIDQSLQAAVSRDEADEVAMAWLLYNRFPDRYCPQGQIATEEEDGWHVPIYLAYSDGRGGPVGEVIVHAGTGVVVNHTPVTKMRSQGALLAETLLNAR